MSTIVPPIRPLGVLRYRLLTWSARDTCLGIIFVGARRDVKALGRPLAVALVGALAILSIAAPALSTKDPYEYILAGILGFHAYSPGPDPFAHTAYAALEHRIPLRGVLYGPLWLALDTAVTGAFTSVYPKLLALRVFNASLLLILLWMSARARASRPVLLILALNPAAWYYLVVNLHVETQGLIAVTAAFLAARRSWGVRAMMLVTVAALIKIVFIVAGAAVFVKFSGVLRRLALWAGATALVLAISYATSGGAYFSDITGHLSFYAARAHQRQAEQYFELIPIVCAIMFLLVTTRRGVFGAAWLFGQLSPLVNAWYLFWGMPYALVTGQLDAFLIALPLFAAMIDLNFSGSSLPGTVTALVMCLLLLDLYLVTRRRFAPSTSCNYAAR